VQVNRFAHILCFSAFILLTPAAEAQKRPPKQKGGDVQTRENARTKEKVNRNEKEAAYVSRRTQHTEIQDKATRKRMKKTLKRAQKQSQGKEIPWYKRMFRKRRF